VQTRATARPTARLLARLPEVAILFPNTKGDQRRHRQADDVKREAMKIDISGLLGGDLYASCATATGRAQALLHGARRVARLLERNAAQELGRPRHPHEC